MNDLRTLLENAADHVRPNDDAFEELARFRRRRARTRRVGTATLALVVAAAGIGVAVMALGGGRGAPHRPVGPPASAGSTASPALETYDDPVGWSLAYPENWSLAPIDQFDGRVSYGGVGVSNFAIAGSVFDPGFLRDFPADGVVVQVLHRSGGPAPTGDLPDSSFPLSFGDLRMENRDDAYPVASSSLDFVGNSFQYSMRVVIGPEVSDTDKEAARSVVASLAFRPLTEGNVIHLDFTFFVLATPDAYPVGSVTRFDGTNLPHVARHAEPSFAFYLVHTDRGFYAVSWPSHNAGGYSDCDLTYDPAGRRFNCADGAVWALDGSVVARPDHADVDDPLEVLLVRRSLDGHVLVSPNEFMPTASGIRTDYGLTGGA